MTDEQHVEDHSDRAHRFFGGADTAGLKMDASLAIDDDVRELELALTCGSEDLEDEVHRDLERKCFVASFELARHPLQVDHGCGQCTERTVTLRLRM